MNLEREKRIIDTTRQPTKWIDWKRQTKEKTIEKLVNYNCTPLLTYTEKLSTSVEKYVYNYKWND